MPSQNGYTWYKNYNNQIEKYCQKGSIVEVNCKQLMNKFEGGPLQVMKANEQKEKTTQVNKSFKKQRVILSS